MSEILFKPEERTAYYIGYIDGMKWLINYLKYEEPKIKAQISEKEWDKFFSCVDKKIKKKDAAEGEEYGKQKVCKLCKYYQYDPQSGWYSCVHPDAKILLTREEDTCRHWEGKE